jgi:hypothetical protein
MALRLKQLSICLAMLRRRRKSAATATEKSESTSFRHWSNGWWK